MLRNLMYKLRYNIVIRLVCYPFMNLMRKIRLNRYAKSSDSQAFFELKNKFSGQQCFVVANGPSLTTDDLDLIKNETTFGVNGIFQLFEQTEWRPTFYTCIDKDSWVLNNSCEYFSNHSYSGTMFLNEAITSKPRNQNVIRIVANSQFSLFRGAIVGFGNYELEHFSIPGAFNQHISVVFVALQTAIYMGFSKIYLIGQDCSYDCQSTHYAKFFKQNFIAHRGIDSVQDRIFQEFVSFKEYASYHGVQIINVTRGGELEIFERKCLEEVV